MNNLLTINGDYRVNSGSPCINKGYNTDASSVGDTDLNGNARIIAVIDIGAFESSETTMAAIFKVKENGEWIGVTKIYKKIGGIWVEQDSSTWETLFNENIKYIPQN